MSDLLTHRVAARYIRAVFVSDKLWREQKSKLRKVVTLPLYEKRPNTLNRYLVDKLLPVYKETVQALSDLGLPVDIETSLEWRLETVTAMIQKLVDSGTHFQQQYEAAKRWGTTRTAEEVVAYAIASEVEDFYSSVVTTVGAGLKFTWGTDQRLIDSLAKRLIKKATPEEQDALVKTDQNDFSTQYLDLKYGFFERVKLKTLAKKIVSREKITYNFAAWIDRLREMIVANYAEGARDYEFRQFDLHGMKVVVDDRTVSDDNIKWYVKYLEQAYQALRSKGLSKVWYGTVFIRCEGCGGVNYNTGGGVGGNYPIGPDVVNVFSRPGKFIVELMAHELGHRYWFKQMTETQRARFESLVKVRKTTGVAPIPEKKLEEARSVIQKTADFFADMLDQFDREGTDSTTIDKYAALFKDAVLNKNPIFNALSKITDRYGNQKLRDAFEEYTGSETAAEFKLRLHCLHLKKDVEEYTQQGGFREDGVNEWISDARTLVQRLKRVAYAYVDLADKLSDGEFDPSDTRPVSPVTEYGGSNIDEAWAEAFAHYVLEFDMTRDQLESFRSVLKTATIENVVRRASTGSFETGFFQRHPKLKRFAPSRILDKSGGSGSHPEARQSGNDVWIFPKFWTHDSSIQDFIFAHELGHLALSKYGLAKMLAHLESLGIDPWDSGNLPFGQHNVEEAFADSFASYFLDGDVGRRYPVWAKALQEVV